MNAQKAQGEQQADKAAADARAQAEREYETKLEIEKLKMQNQYYPAPQQMNSVVVPQAASYQQPAPPGAVPAYQQQFHGAPSGAPPGPPPGLPPALRTATALAPYTARSANELSMASGEIVLVIEESPNGWTKVSSKQTGQAGWVPATYIRIHS